MMNLFSSEIVARGHLSKDVLIRLLDDELAPAKSRRAAEHLHHCGQCQERFDSAGRTGAAAIEYRANLIARLEPLSPAKRDFFIQRLDETLESVSEQAWWKRLLVSWPGQRWGSSLPTLTSTLAVVLAVAVLSFLWRGRLPAVSAAELLKRAVAADSSFSSDRLSGVLRRRLRIRTKHKTIERDLYKDTSGRRQPKYVRKSKEEADLAARLTLAGVNWDDPLSAVSFRAWRDRQIGSHDEIQATNDGLLTITTRSPSTNITSESLTVRQDSFHPVEKTVEFRDFGSVTISEISVDVLNWDKGGAFFVEPETRGAAPERTAPAALPNEAQIDETELLARLALNRNDADSGEQIEVARDSNGIQVRGLVESKDRKEELNESLKAIPFLSVKLQSFDEAKPLVDSVADTPLPQEQRFVVAQVSPLEQYFVEHGRDRDELSRISAGLFDCSVSITRLSRALEQIARRFSDNTVLSAASIRARDEVLSRDTANLLQNLKQQQQFLEEARINTRTEALPSNDLLTDKIELASMAERDMAATRELISGSPSSTHSAGQTAAQLAEIILELRTAAVTFTSSRSTQP
jgi:hypothetical protein